MKICERRQDMLDYPGHILVEGGPGAGKTTLALLKAHAISRGRLLKTHQKVLFLSFARATISRIEEQARDIIAKEDKRHLEINTYHGFTWSIIQSYGYLLRPHRFFRLITPPNFSASIAGINSDAEVQKYKYDLLNSQGIICFDLFGELVSELFTRSDKICRQLSDRYPYVIVDEFQDTDTHEWEIIKQLGKYSKIIALADLNQRIFEFRGASVTRVPEFAGHFGGHRLDLGLENNRSTALDIVQFGDDILTGMNKGKKYKNVKVITYTYYKPDPKLPLLNALKEAFRRKKAKGKSSDWSLAILVKRKSDTLKVSSYLTSQRLSHEVIIDPEGPSLSAGIIAKVLEPNPGKNHASLIYLLCQHIKGRKGTKVSKQDIQLTQFLEEYKPEKKVVDSKRKLLITEIMNIINQRAKLSLTGLPEKDWIAVRNLFRDSKHEVLKQVFEDSRFLKLLNKGAVLSEGLSDQWRSHQAYPQASQLVDAALTQEHFAMTNRTSTGIFVMNLHKSKGKEFEEVIIWEELYNPIVNPDVKRIAQDKLVLRVAVTRARSFTTFLTPKMRPCILL